MVLAIDAGNTNIVLGGWEGDELRFVSRLETDRLRTEDSYAVELQGVFGLYGVDAKQFDGAILSSVVPQLSRILARAVEKLTGTPPLIVGPGIKTGLNIRIDDPGQLGSDIVVDAVAALAKYPKPIIIVDMGTATTISVIDEDGVFRGGTITAGIRVSVDALIHTAAQLQQVEISAPDDIIGTNTVDSMRSGAVYGAASMIDGMVERISERLGKKATVVATGGNSGQILRCCRCGIIHDANLLLEGLIRLYRKNTPQDA